MRRALIFLMVSVALKVCETDIKRFLICERNSIILSPSNKLLKNPGRQTPDRASAGIAS
jgi:hypothetical protein